MLHVHRAERADALVAALGELLAEPLADPFEAEVVAVHTRGMERWLTQRLSARLGASAGRGDGVCANVDFPTPHRLVVDTVAAASGVAPDEDPWLAERAVWPLLAVVDECLDEPWLAGLRAHMRGEGDARRLYAVRRIAELFDRYALARPAMVLAWGAGEDVGDGGEPLAADAVWQPRLWRALRARIGLASPAERLQAACARLQAQPSVAPLPARVSLFGLTRLPAGQLQVLAALAAAREIHLFALHPSPALWEEVAARLQSAPPPRTRRADTTADVARNPLLASWGRDARELQLVLAAAGGRTDHHHAVPAAAPDTLLGRIQAAVRGDQPPPGAPAPGEVDDRPPMRDGDASVRIHACHGRARQVEVLRDAILHLLADDLTLQPRDVVVMCPDIEAFAPLIAAAFGAAEQDEQGAAPGPRPVDLRVRLADRSLEQTNPLLGVVAELLALAEQRVTASQVLDLADREPVRRRFALDDDDLGRLRDWIADSAIHWGLDAEHRRPFKLDGLPSGTFRAGLQRLLLGVAMTEEGQRRFGEVLPLDDVESGAIDLAGRFAELVARLAAAVDSLAQPLAIDGWARAIAAAADALAQPAERDAWQRTQLQRILDELVGQASTAGAVAHAELSLGEVRALLTDRLAGRPTRASFRTGHLTVCTLMPMRSVPHRVVCLLGLDDGAFPRASARDDDDLTLAEPQVGERDPRSEDRQLLLDALLAATERLIVTYTGNDERTNIARPPAVPVGELLDAIDATVRLESDRSELLDAIDATVRLESDRSELLDAIDATVRLEWDRSELPARSRVVVRHPLQPFDPRNFAPDALVSGRAWSFDAAALRGARALAAGSRPEPEPFLARPLAPPVSELVALEDLVGFVEHPVRAFLRQRLGVSLRSFTEEVQDALRVELDPLARWAVGDRLLRARLAGVDARTAGRAEIARGTLPPGALGRPVLREVMPVVEAIVAEASGLLAGLPAAASVDVRVPLADGRTLGGTVTGVHASPGGGDLLLATTYSRVAPRHRLAAWVRLLALCAADPSREPRAVTVGRARQGGGVTVARIAAPAHGDAKRRAQAMRHLAAIVDLYDRGMREPLPLYCATSAAYAAAAACGDDPVAQAARQWTSEYGYDREDRAEEHQLVLGGVRTFAQLLAQPPRDDEGGPGWEADESSRLGRLARRLWDGLLQCEEVFDV